MKARALHFVAPGAVEVRPVDVPEPAADEVLVRTEFTGISGGTETLAYRGEIDSDLPLDETIGALGGTFRFPFRYGYSAVGVVERSRSPAAPERARVFAFHPHQDRFVVPAADVVRLDREDPRLATLLPLAETGLQVALDAAATPGGTVAVIGLGPVGILAGAVVTRSGAGVLGADPRAWRRDAAEAFGLRAVPPEALPEAVAEATGGRGADVAVEASGSPEALAAALPLLRHEGTALVASWYGTRAVPLPLGADFHRRRLTIRSTQVSTIPAALAGRWDRRRRRDAARALLSDLPLAVLATHEFPFQRAAEAFDAVAHGAEGLLHAALTYA